MKIKKLPTAEALFQQFFTPWYPATSPAPTAPRPDLFIIAGSAGKSLQLSELQYLSPEFLEAAKNQIAEIIKTGLEDFHEIVEFSALDVDVLNAVLENYEHSDIAELLTESDPDQFSNPYLVTVCVFGAILGRLFTQEPGFDWLYGYPYFHSIIVHSATGLGIPVFDWMIKRFSADAINEDLTQKFENALGIVAQRSADQG